MSRLSERTCRVSFCHLCRAMVSPKPGHVRLHASKAYLRYSTIITEYNRRGPVVGDFPEPYSAHCANISFTAQASERPSRISYSYRWIESNTCGSWRRYQYCQPGPHWLAFDSNFQAIYTPHGCQHPIPATIYNGIHNVNKAEEREALIIHTADENPQTFMAAMRRKSFELRDSVSMSDHHISIKENNSTNQNRFQKQYKRYSL